MKFPVLMLALILAVPSAMAQSFCPGIFLGERAAFAARLRRAADASQVQRLQEHADLQRRVLKSLFVDTDLFLKDDHTKRWITLPPRPNVEQIQARLRQMARNHHLDKPEIIEILRLATHEKSLEVAEIIARAFARSPGRIDQALDEGIRGKVLNEKGEELSRQRVGNLRPAKISGAIASGATLAGVLIATGGVMDPMVFAAGPVYAAVKMAVAINYNAAPGWTKIREIYRNTRARRQTKGLARDMRELFQDVTSIQAENNSDYAFEKAWDGWHQSVALAEAAPGPRDLNHVSRRLAQLSLLVRTTALWQLPNGERFADVARTGGTLLTDGRKADMNKGLERKRDQLDLMNAELQWIERDVAAIGAGLKNEARTMDQDLAATTHQFLAELGRISRETRTAIEDRQDQLQFMSERLDADDASFRAFVGAIARETP